MIRKEIMIERLEDMTDELNDMIDELNDMICLLPVKWRVMLFDFGIMFVGIDFMIIYLF